MSFWQPANRSGPSGDPVPSAVPASTGDLDGDLDAPPVLPSSLPTMAMLERFSADLDGIDAALARMDDDASLPSRS